MRIKARATLDPTKQAAFSIPRGQGFLTVQVDQEFRPRMGEQLQALSKRQKDKFDAAVNKWNDTPPEMRGKKPVYQDFLLDLEFELVIHFRKRSLDHNALMWVLYEIEANYINGTPLYSNGYWSKRLPDRIVTPMDLHDDDVDVYAVKKTYRIERKDRPAFDRGMRYAELGRIWGEPKDDPTNPDWIIVTLAKTTQFLDSKEMTDWVTRIKDRIVDNGLLKSDESRFLEIKQDLMEIIKGGKKR